MQRVMDAPTSFRETGPGCLEIRSGGGCIAVFGLPFFGAGCFLTAIGLGLLPLENASEVPLWGWPVMVLTGLVFVGVGGTMSFGRKTLSIDVPRGLVVQQWSLLVPVKVTEIPLGRFTDVVIGFTPGDSDSSERFPVSLSSSSGVENLEAASPTDYATAFQQAQALVRLLRFPLRDRTSGQDVVLSPDAPSPGARGRACASIPIAAAAPRPAAMRSTVEETGGAVRILVPGLHPGPSIVLRFAVPLAVAVYALTEFGPFFERSSTPEEVQWFLLGFLGLILLFPLGGAVAAVVRGFRSKTVVKSDGSGVVLEETGAWRTRTTTLPRDSILMIADGTRGSALESAERSGRHAAGWERSQGADSGAAKASVPGWVKSLAHLVPSKGVIIKSTTGIHTFGQGLPDEEIRYLRWIVARAVAGGSSSTPS
jgi:hypothetical protein